MSQELDSAHHFLGRQQVIDQDQSAKHFSNGHRSLLAIGDASVGYALPVESKKVVVLRYDDTSGGGGELKVRPIRCTDQARIRSGCDVDVTASKTLRDVGGDVFVEMKADRHRSRCFFQALLAQFRF